MASIIFFKSLIYGLILLTALYTIILVTTKAYPTSPGGVQWWSTTVTSVNVLVIMVTLGFDAFATFSNDSSLLRITSMVIGGYGVGSIWTPLMNFYLTVALAMVGYGHSQHLYGPNLAVSQPKSDQRNHQSV